MDGLATTGEIFKIQGWGYTIPMLVKLQSLGAKCGK
jgi:hypothetical protein